MLYFNLKAIFAARQIEKPYSFLVKIGISSLTAHKILNNDCHVIRLDHIELICRALYCEPNDLIAFRPDKLNPLPKDHPLNNLIDDENDWQNQLKKMPIAKLKELAKNQNAKE